MWVMVLIFCKLGLRVSMKFSTDVADESTYRGK